jgi:hypothetical protein
MKLRLLFILVAAALASVQTSCMTEYTKVTAPDGTVTESKHQRIEDGVLPFAGRVIEAYSPRRLPDRVTPTK